jgi:hypothetical protein
VPVGTTGKVCDTTTSLTRNRFCITVTEKLEKTKDSSEQAPLIRSPTKEYEPCSKKQNFGRP